MFDIDGLIEPSRKELNQWQIAYAHSNSPCRDLHQAVEQMKPNILIGVSTQGGAFTKPVVESMAKTNGRPIIFALSNPTEKAECTAQQAYDWSEGKVLYASGVQFPEVRYNGHAYQPGQANNFYVYPSIALAVYLTRPKLITDDMFITAAQGLADQVTPAERERGMLYPPQRGVYEVEVKTALKIVRMIFDNKLAQVDEPDDLVSWTEAQLYKPEYEGEKV